MTAVKLHYTDEGQGEPVIILHGLFGSGRNWTGIGKRLAAHYRIIRPDLRNHGASEHAGNMTVTAMAADILTLMEDLRLRNAHLLGHSLGGKVAMTLALRHSDSVNKLVVLDMAPVEYDNNLQFLIRAMERLPLVRIRTRQQAEDFLRRDIPAARLRQFLLQNLAQADHGYRWRINLPAIRRHLNELSGFPLPPGGSQFPGPALFLHGAESNYLLPEHHPIIQQYFPAAVIEPLAGAGHWLHADQPRAVCQALVRFLAGRG